MVAHSLSSIHNTFCIGWEVSKLEIVVISGVRVSLPLALALALALARTSTKSPVIPMNIIIAMFNEIPSIDLDAKRWEHQQIPLRMTVHAVSDCILSAHSIILWLPIIQLLQWNIIAVNWSTSRCEFSHFEIVVIFFSIHFSLSTKTCKFVNSYCLSAQRWSHTPVLLYCIFFFCMWSLSVWGIKRQQQLWRR